MENQNTKIWWDFNIRADRVIEARRPDIVVIEKNQETFIIDVAMPNDFHVRDNEDEKILKYQYLALNLSRIRKTKSRVIPIVIGALRAESLLTEYL